MKNSWMAVAFGILSFPTALMAEDSLQFSASAAINFKTGDYIPKVDPDIGLKFKNTTLDLGFTVFSNRYYVALNYDTTLKEDYAIVNGGNTEVEITRLDYGITAGYEIGAGWGVFLGYKVGETEQEFIRTPAPVAGSVSYYDKGPFVGVSYGHNFGKAGSFSASIAYADFDGEIRQTNEISGGTLRTKGTTTGLSYGLKWTKEVREGRTLALGYKHHDYRFEDKDRAFNTSRDLDQEYDIIYVQVSEYFD